MDLLFYTHKAALEHDTGPSHPEAPARLRRILAMLDDQPLSGLIRKQAEKAELSMLERVHEPDHVQEVLRAVPTEGHVALDADTWLSPASGRAALRAAGAVVQAVDTLMAGEAKRAFSAMRPPGHHAERARAMGFCLFDNIAVGAAHALEAHGLERVAIMDFDVHHGNGTQAIFEDEPRVLFASTHQSPLFPGTGAASETGVGNIINRPYPPFTPAANWRAMVERDILPRMFDFRPRMVLISAGFDAHERDPLANGQLTEADFAWIGERMVELAEHSAEGRIVGTLEGGYDPQALAASLRAHLEALMRA